MFSALKILARMKFLRGTAFDIFGYNKERKQERTLIVEYEQLSEKILDLISDDNYETCVSLLSLPEMIRGYGPVKERNIEEAEKSKLSLCCDIVEVEVGRRCRG